MKNGRRESLILGSLDHFFGILRLFFAKSLILQSLCGLFVACESRFRTGIFRVISDAETDRHSWKYRFRRAVLRAGEKSAIGRLSKKMDDTLINASMESYGSFGILFGGISSALWFVREPNARDMRALLTSLIVLIVSLPLLQSKGSLFHAVKNSLFIGSFLFDFCMLSSDRHTDGEEGKRHPWSCLFWALVCGGLSYWIPCFYFPMIVLIWIFAKISLACPELPILLLVTTLPFFNLFSHPTILLCTSVAICIVVWFKKALSGKRSLRFGLIDFTVLLLALLFLFGGVVGFGLTEGLFRGFGYFSVILFWFPASGLLGQSLWRERAIGGMRISALLLAFLGIFQYFFTDLELKWTDTSRFSDIGGRVCGVFSNPNIFAVYLLLTAPLFLMGAFDKSKGWRSRLYSAAGYLAVSFCTVLTWSRGAWLGMIVAFVIFVLCGSRRSFSWTFLSIPVMLLGCSYLPHSVLNRFGSIGVLSESSIRYRLYTWKGVFRMLRAYPFGIGTGDTAFHTVYPMYAVSGTENVMHTHHLLLQIFAELGIFGAVVLIVLLFILLLLFFYTLKSLHNRRRTQALGCFCSIAGTFIMGLFDYPWYHLGNCLLFFTVAAGFGVLGIGEKRF